jgi:hypothetical protein
MRLRVLRILQIVARFVVPLIPTVAIVVGTYDYFRPWSLAETMVPNRAGQTRLLVGAGYSSQSTYAASGNITERTAEYLFYPEVFRTKETYVLSRRSDSAPSVSSTLFSPVLYVIGMIAAVVLVVAAWWLPLAKRN